MVQAQGLFDGTAGAAFAQMLSGGGQQTQKRESTMFDTLPSLMQAMSFADARQAQSQAALGQLALKQQEYDNQQAAYNAVMNGDDPVAQRAANYARAGIDPNVTKDILSNVLNDQTETRKANALSKWNEELRATQLEGIAPEQAVPLVMERMRADKEIWRGFAESVGSSVEGLDKAQNQAIENLKRGEQFEATVFWQGAIDAMTEEAQKGGGLAVMLRKPEFLLSYLPKKMVDEAIQFSTENPPPQGMTQEQWTQRNVDIARRNSLIMTNAQGAKGAQQGMDAVKAVVGIMNESYQPLFNQQQAATAQMNAQTHRIAATRPRSGGRGSDPGEWTTSLLPQGSGSYDFNRNGRIDKGAEQAAWKIAMNNGEMGPKQQTGSTETTQEVKSVPRPGKDRAGNPIITSSKQVTKGKAVSGQVGVGGSLSRVRNRIQSMRPR